MVNTSTATLGLVLKYVGTGGFEMEMNLVVLPLILVI
jgi:hypothetical protein